MENDQSRIKWTQGSGACTGSDGLSVTKIHKVVTKQLVNNKRALTNETPAPHVGTH